MKQVATVRKFAKLFLLVAFLIGLPAARASQADQAVKVTFSQDVQVPGRVLSAGTYWFVVPEFNERFEVEVFNADRTKLITMFLTNDAQRAEANEHGVFTFAERGPSEPQAIMKWFYPGNTTGHEFVYPKQLEKELAKDKHDTVVAGD
jgi:hypothetical protein